MEDQPLDPHRPDMGGFNDSVEVSVGRGTPDDNQEEKEDNENVEE